MHRTRHVLKLGAWGLLTAGLAAGVTAAQSPTEPNHVSPSSPIQAVGGQPPAEQIPPGTPRVSTGKAVIVAINGSQKITMSTKKPIRTAENEKESVARVQATPEPTSVVIVGLQAGSTRVKLTDVDGAVENFDILVQLDIDAVKSVIHLTFPTANVTPIAAGTNTIVLTGNVAHAEDIEPILRVARGVLGAAGQGGAEVYNAMTVGGVRQVQLDVTIAQVNRTEGRLRNLNFIINGSTVSAGSITPPSLLQPPMSASSLTGGAGVGITPFAFPAQPNSTSNIVFGIVPANFNVLMQALRNEGVSKLLAEPKLITMSGHPAEFLSGGQQGVISVSSGVSGAGVDYKPVGTKLRFLPIVLANGKIFLEVSPSVTAPDAGFGVQTSFGFSTGFSEQSITTRVTMESGQTFAIGGLIQTQVQTTTSKLPFFGDLPFIGTLFNSVNSTDTEQELVVLVTPYLIDPMDCKQAPCRLPGNETRKPDDYELFLEAILEAPRGQRDVFQGNKYVPAYKSDPTADKFPCGGDRSGCANGTCGAGCAGGGCGVVPAVPVPVAPPPSTLPK